MRIFLAIDVNSEMRDRVAQLRQELEPHLGSARWVPAENLHVTLRFIGDVEPDFVDPLDAALRAAVAQETPFSIAFDACGVFPNTKCPRVLWVGLDELPQALGRLQAASETAVRSLGVAPETRPFRPHLTIARFKGRETQLAARLHATSRESFGTVSVAKLTLYESTLSARGASYRVLRRFPLGGTEREELL